MKSVIALAIVLTCGSAYATESLDLAVLDQLTQTPAAAQPSCECDLSVLSLLDDHASPVDAATLPPAIERDANTVDATKVENKPATPVRKPKKPALKATPAVSYQWSYECQGGQCRWVRRPVAAAPTKKRPAVH